MLLCWPIIHLFAFYEYWINIYRNSKLAKKKMSEEILFVDCNIHPDILKVP